MHNNDNETSDSFLSENNHLNITQLKYLETILDWMDDDDYSTEIGGPVLRALIEEYGRDKTRFEDALRLFRKMTTSFPGPTNEPGLVL